MLVKFDCDTYIKKNYLSKMTLGLIIHISWPKYYRNKIVQPNLVTILVLLNSSHGCAYN